MPKTDWESVGRDTIYWFEINDHYLSQTRYEQIISLNTRRTKEDLPENGLWWVWFPEEPKRKWLATFVNHKICDARCCDARRFLHTIGANSWKTLKERVLDLEIGPEVVPPEERNHEA